MKNTQQSTLAPHIPWSQLRLSPDTAVPRRYGDSLREGVASKAHNVGTHQHHGAVRQARVLGFDVRTVGQNL